MGEKHETTLHQSGMRNRSPDAVEDHPKGPSVNKPDRPSADYVPDVSVPGPRNA